MATIKVIRTREFIEEFEGSEKNELLRQTLRKLADMPTVDTIKEMRIEVKE